MGLLYYKELQNLAFIIESENDMKKAFKLIYIILFVLICAAPLALMPFVKNDAKIEKRELTKLPKFMEGDRLNLSFSTTFESWFNDRIPFRAELLSAANFIKADTLHAPSSNVIDGKDGWLFYGEEGQGYMNTNAMTDAQINAAAITIDLIEECVETKGGHFTFVPAPNKASVYGEYLPYCYTKAKENNLSRLTDKLKELDVNFVDMKEVLTEQKDKGLYHRRDSHWNYQGALIGYNAIMDSLGKDHKTYEDADYKKEKTWRADLDKLLYPKGGFMDYQYNYDIDFTDFTFTFPMNAFDAKGTLENFMSDKEQGDDKFQTANSNVTDGSNLYMARDSFGRAVLPFFIDNYSTTTFKRTASPDLATLQDGTDLVFEIVERNLKNIINTAPYMYAPKRDHFNDKIFPGKGEVTSFCNSESYGTKLFGIFPDDADLSDSRVAVRLTSDNDERNYEAFPIFESKLIAEKLGKSEEEMAAESADSCGYSLLINPEDALDGTYHVTIYAHGTQFDAGDVEFEAPEVEEEAEDKATEEEGSDSKAEDAKDDSDAKDEEAEDDSDAEAE